MVFPNQAGSLQGPYLKGLGPWERGGKTHTVEFRFVSGQKVIMWGGVLLLLIARTGL